MKKSLIAVAVAGLFAAPAAMAEVTLSGAINLGIEVARSSSSGTTQSLTRTLLNSNYSHIDIESVDDIGGGNKVIFHYQMQVNPQTTGPNGGPFNRDSFLGIAGGWGAFKMGTNENVYERFMYQADPIDGALGPGGNLMLLGTPGAGTAFDAGQSGCGPTNGTGCIGFYRRTDQTIWYESPDFGGFTFEIDQTLSAFKQSDSTSASGAGYDPKVLSVGGKFQPAGGPFYVDLAYEKHDDMFGLVGIAAANGVAITGTSSKDTGLQLGGGFMIGDLGLHARYERLKYELSGGPINEYKRDAYWFGVKFALPTGYIGGEVGIARDGKLDGTKQDNTGAKMYGVGYFHNLSKQSQLQFIYGRTDNEDSASYIQAGGPNNGVLGSDHQVFHVGIKHTY